MATIYDAVDVAAIPAGAETVLAYIDGDFQTLGAVRARFPHATILTVTTNGRNRANICDVESGDATPAIAAEGVRDGLYKTAYSAKSNKGPLDAAMGALNWDWYAADPTGEEHLDSDSVATQWAWPGHGSPGNFDISVTNGTWPNVAPVPAPTPPAPPSGPTNYPEDNVRSFAIQCSISKGKGWTPLPAGVAPSQVVSIVPVDLDPATIGQFADIPQLAGVTGDDKLVFGPGAGGIAANMNGNYSFTLWAAG